MKIDRLKFNTSFKNLHKKFEIDFFEQDVTTVIVGRNGTGKSNILEALLIIFRDLDLGQPPERFAYEIWYKIGEYSVHIDADYDLNRSEKKRRTYYILDIEDNDGNPVSVTLKDFFGEKKRVFLPRYVFGYYSGPSNRLEEHFQPHQERFRKQLIEDSPDDEVPATRPLLYARLIHSQFALLAFFLERNESVVEFLKEHLRIVGLDSVLFTFKMPNWANRSEQKKELFWSSKGTVRRFVERLYTKSLAPFRDESSNEPFYMYIDDERKLQELAKEYLATEAFEVGETSFQSFFKALESTYISDLLDETIGVRIRVKVESVDGSLTFREMSEGEQQLLMVLGLMRFTQEDESLFLLDEPDTHLNPAWSVKYLNFIEEIVGQTESSQLIITTHNPLTLASLTREQVIILTRDEKTGVIKADLADRNPRGMGVGGILTSDIFGLRSVLDPITLQALDRQRELSVKAERQRLSATEQDELEQLNEEVADLDFRNVVRDPLYPPYVSEITEYNQEQELNKLVLSPEERQRQRIRVKDIVRRLKRESGES